MGTNDQTGGQVQVITDGGTKIVKESSGDTATETRVTGNNVTQVTTDLNTGASTTVSSDGNLNTKLVVDNNGTTEVVTDVKTGNTTQVVITDTGSQTINNDGKTGIISIVNNDGSTSETSIQGNTIVNTQIVNNVTTNTYLDTKTNTFTVVNDNNETIGGGPLDQIDPKIIDDVIKIVDVKPVVQVEPPQVTLAAEPAKTEEKKTTKPSVSPAAAASGLITSAARLPTQTWLDPTILKSSGPERQYEDPLAKLRRIEEQWEPQTMINQPEPTFEEETPYYAYGQEDSIDDILAMLKTPEEEEPTYRQGGMVLPLLQAKGGHIAPTLLESRAVDRKYQSPLQQYKGRENFKEGKHVAGPGDGQSDDIPAWLADGEYVLDAELVSALGNGSTKAGVALLDEFRRQVRAHKRSGSLNSIPPKSKSPLSYFMAAEKALKKK
jgi:hypothetical protein